jgi:hypothetical protein
MGQNSAAIVHSLQFKIKIHEVLPQGELPQREERLRKTFFVFLLPSLFIKIKRGFLSLSSLCGSFP